MRPAGDGRGAFFCDLLLLAVRARCFIGSDSDGIQHSTALMINPVTGGQPGGERFAQVMRCPVERPVLQVRQLMQRFSDPMSARTLLQSQQNSDEALSIKRDADPAFDFCGYLEALPDADGMFMGNANIVPRQPRVYLYHAYLVYMEAHGYKNTLSLTMFGKGLSAMLKEYSLNYDKRRTNQGMQTNLTLREESNADWLPKCDEPAF